MIKKLIGARIKREKDLIIEIYQSGEKCLAEIADEYNVVETTLYRQLHKWGIPIKRSNYKTRINKYNMKERKFSPELLEKIKENTQINNAKIKYVNFERSTEDQKLIDNILSRPIIG